MDNKKILTGDTVRVVLCDVRNLAFCNVVGLPCLTEKDLAAADKFSEESDKVSRLISAYLKRKYVGKWTENDCGKPVAENVFFNVSHCDGAVLFVCSENEIGIDAEKVRPISDAIKNRVLSEYEMRFAGSDEDFLALWTAKESLVKARGTGVDRRPQYIPSMPFNGVKEFCGEKYYAVVLTTDGIIVSVVRKGEKPFTAEITKERLPLRK